jgi:hypothetical protein
MYKVFRESTRMYVTLMYVTLLSSFALSVESIRRTNEPKPPAPGCDLEHEKGQL